MKKYIAAAAVAVMVFAFAAFAASLNVNGGILAAGSDDLACAESADITYDYGLFQGEAWIQAFHIEFSDESCVGASYGLEALNEEGSVIGTVHGAIEGQTVVVPTTANVPIEDVETLTLLVHSDPTASNLDGWTSPPYGGGIPFPPQP